MCVCVTILGGMSLHYLIIYYNNARYDDAVEHSKTWYNIV